MFQGYYQIPINLCLDISHWIDNRFELTGFSILCHWSGGWQLLKQHCISLPVPIKNLLDETNTLQLDVFQ